MNLIDDKFKAALESLQNLAPEGFAEMCKMSETFTLPSEIIFAGRKHSLRHKRLSMTLREFWKNAFGYDAKKHCLTVLIITISIFCVVKLMRNHH